MSEQINSILVAVAYTQNVLGASYSLEQLQEFSTNDNRLILEDDQLWLVNKKVIEIVESVQKEATNTHLAPFQKQSVCIKCGFSNDFSRSQTTYDKQLDLLVRSCRSCKYEWYERPADYKEDPPGEIVTNADGHDI